MKRRQDTYSEFLDQELSLPSKKERAVVLDLFAGCGGLALGFESLGFQTIGFESDPDCCATYTHNLHSPCHQMRLSPGQELTDGADVIIGGPPCQPFSVIGHQNGNQDDRDGFPAFLWAVERYQPKIALFENVRGMLFQNRAYFEEIVEQLKDLAYEVDWKILNAVNFGVPQNRERLFVVAYRDAFEFPEPTHKNSPISAGYALGDLAKDVPPGAKFLTTRMDAYVAKYEKASKCTRPRDLHLDIPSRTVTCRNLNGATGDMLRLRLKDERRRRLTVREGARLQSFPDWFVFQGSEGSQFNQVGNAVPPLLAKAMATAVKRYLASNFGTTSRMSGSSRSRGFSCQCGRKELCSASKVNRNRSTKIPACSQ